MRESNLFELSKNPRIPSIWVWVLSQVV